MFEITLSEDLRARLDALKDIALNQWRENGVSLFLPNQCLGCTFMCNPVRSSIPILFTRFQPV